MWIGRRAVPRCVACFPRSYPAYTSRSIFFFRQTSW